MAYIEPNSVIQLLSGCPLDKGYKNTIYFRTPLEQTNYFQTLQEVTLTKSSYQRWEDGVIHVNFPADVCLRCNYMMFQNTAYSDKWFYAFIDSVDYVNNNCTKISFTIDVMQTWYFNYNILPSFVEREHTETDEIYEHMVGENIEIGDLINVRKIDLGWDSQDTNLDKSIVIQYVPGSYLVTGVGYNPAGENFENMYPVEYINLLTNLEGGKRLKYRRYNFNNNFMQGCAYFSVPLYNNGNETIDYNEFSIPNVINKIVAVIEFIEGKNALFVPDKVGTIINLFIAPTIIVNSFMNNELFSRTSNFTPINTFKYKGSTNTYTPKNKKLFNFPYKQLHMSNNSGAKNIYSWEEFDERGIASFRINGFISGLCEAGIYPLNYKGQSANYEEGLLLNNFPSVSWNQDSFNAWLGRNKDYFVFSSLMNVISNMYAVPSRLQKITPNMGEMEDYTRNALTSVGDVPRLTGETLPTVMRTRPHVYASPRGVTFALLDSINTLHSQMSVPNKPYGEMYSNAITYVQRRLCFTFYDMGIDGETAEVIDSFFDIFGYACKKIKVPNVKTVGASLRPHWNYIQTMDCNIVPITKNGLPADDQQNISEIYNRGITFWMNGNEVGNYTLDNRPTDNNPTL